LNKLFSPIVGLTLVGSMLQAEPIKPLLRTYSESDQDFTLLQLYIRVFKANPNIKIVEDSTKADMTVGLTSTTLFGAPIWSTALLQ
jgi:hypothetical protein